VGSELHPTASESRRSCGVDLGEMISLEETERNLKTMSSWCTFLRVREEKLPKDCLLEQVVEHA
jgi:hypothetical protein